MSSRPQRVFFLIPWLCFPLGWLHLQTPLLGPNSFTIKSVAVQQFIAMRELFSRRLKNCSRIILEWTIKEEVVILKSITSTGIWNQFKDQVLDFMPPPKQTHPKPTKLWVGRGIPQGKLCCFYQMKEKWENTGKSDRYTLHKYII